MNAKETKEWNSIQAPAMRLHIQETMPPPVNDDEVVRWYEAALKRQGLKDAREWGGTAQALAEALYAQLDILWGFKPATTQGETKVTDPENIPTENESAAPESFPVFPESPVVVYPSDRPSVIYEMPDGTSVGFSVTLRLGGTAEMALELIGQFVALFDQYGLKPGHGVVVMGKQPQAAPPPPAQPARPANVPSKASPFGPAQPSAPASEAAEGAPDKYGNKPGELKVERVESVSFNQEDGKKYIGLRIKGLGWPERIYRADHMKAIADALSGMIDFNAIQYGAAYPVEASVTRRVSNRLKPQKNNSTDRVYYLDFVSFELGGAPGSSSDLPF